MMFIYDGRPCFYQWDTNQKITSPNFEVGDEIHFFNIKQKNAIVVLAYRLEDKVVADVPNILLQSSYSITAYRYVYESTIEECTFTVTQRAKPDDYVYTETEILSYATLDERVRNLENSEIDANAVKTIIEEYIEEHPITVEESDPTVPQWAKSEQKPSYTASEVGALPEDTPIPEDCHIKYLESLDTENKLNLFEMESGTYILYGKFIPFPGSPTTLTFAKLQLVSISNGTLSTCVQVFYPPDNAIQYLNIWRDEEAELGYDYERKDAKLYYMEDTRYKKTTIDQYSSDSEYPSSKAVYAYGQSLISYVNEELAKITVPTKVSELENDNNYVQENQVTTVVNEALATAKESGEFNGADGKDGTNGVDGADGENGATFIPTVSSDGMLSWSNDKGLDNPTPINVKGADGADGTNGKDGTNGTDGKDGVGVSKSEINSNGELVITYSDGTSTTLGVVVGAKGQDGQDGANGKDGVNGSDGNDGVGISSASINDSGELVIVLTDETSLNLGVVVGKDGTNGVDGTNGSDGQDGVSVTHSWSGTTLTISSASGTSSSDLKGEKGDKGDTGTAGAQGEKGDPFTYEDFTVEQLASLKGEKGDKGDKGDTGATGENGYTPQKGVDYWTDSDKEEIINNVLASLPAAEGASF